MKITCEDSCPSQESNQAYHQYKPRVLLQYQLTKYDNNISYVGFNVYIIGEFSLEVISKISVTYRAFVSEVRILVTLLLTQN
jgi:hypothetical protein